jgi:hypothetical protein
MNGQRRVLLLVISASLLMLFPVSARSDTPNRVALVVRLGDGSVRAKCVEFNEAQITGLDALTRSSLSVIYEVSGSSATVCKIQSDGCNFPSQPCFCQCSGGSSCIYWSYWHLKSGVWQYSQQGASSYIVSNGDVEGWVWGDGSPRSASAPQPLLVEFNSVCAPPSTSTPTATTAPSATPTATHTPRPTATSVPAVSVSFTAQAERITAGECSTLRWDVEYARAVFLEGQGVPGHASQQVCPKQTQTFELRVVSASGEAQRRVTVTVIQPPASPTISLGTPTSAPTSLPASLKSAPVIAPQSLSTATTRPSPTPLVTTTAVAALASLPTVTLVPTVAAFATRQKVATVQSRRTSARPMEPKADEADTSFPLELLGWAAIVGALLATLVLVNVLKHQRSNS